MNLKKCKSVPVEKASNNNIIHSEYKKLNQLQLTNKSNKSLNKSHLGSYRKLTSGPANHSTREQNLYYAKSKPASWERSI